MELIFAFALNNENIFGKKHFGDAEKFLIYKVNNDEIILYEEAENPFINFNEEQEHGSKLKAKAIIKFLKEKNVNVLVSRQFGRNIKRINSYFIPIIIYSDETNDAIQAINKHLHWIKDELKNSSGEYNLFTIKSGILKSKIKK
ncbi:MAG: NifB/NifX family molybdenum-iron cluster-binding protein [Bacteroidales bacterium]|nr:NifB/NifX family molybdenum-iron cluster-binding protein [Bacteroidales bacterium]MBN2758420.1 NifB/NifX family molybdenum-iron cluster-binding protein [Bacteroidales bacterium]